MENNFISRGVVTVNLRFVTNISRTGNIIVFYGETVWATREDGTTGWEYDVIAKFFYDSGEKACAAEEIIRRHIGAIAV